jgi:AraC-like DNA-binding protein
LAILIRAGDVPAARRVDAWLSVVCEALGPLDVRINPDIPLQGQIEAGQLGSLGVGRVQTLTPHSVHRTPGLIRRDAPDLLRVVVPVSGTVLLAQDGRTARVGTGDLAIYDFSRPYELIYDASVQLTVFSFARELLGVPADSVRRLTAVPISGDGGTAALALPLMSRVAVDVDSYHPVSASRLSTVVMDLLTATVAERASQLSVLDPQTRERLLVRQVQAFVEEHLSETGLSPGVVAAAHHVSLRYLHRLFESQDVTLAAWIRHRRLERCRRDLADPALAEQQVSAIGARWGLSDPAHFSRSFRDAYGMPPVEYRRTYLTSTS